MHLVDDLVGWVGERHQVRVDARPRPRAGVGVAFDEDVLRGGANIADGGDGGLVHVEDEGLVLVVVLVVGVEDLLPVSSVIKKDRRGNIRRSRLSSMLQPGWPRKFRTRCNQ